MPFGFFYPKSGRYEAYDAQVLEPYKQQTSVCNHSVGFCATRHAELNGTCGGDITCYHCGIKLGTKCVFTTTRVTL